MVLVSGYLAETLDVSAVTALGARFLSKPARPSELLAAIEQTIERSIDRR